MKQLWMKMIMVAVLPSYVVAAPAHLDIMVPDTISDQLKGRVKSVETDVCKNVSADHEKKRMEFDQAGNLTATLNWDSGGELTHTTTNLFDESGNYYRYSYVKCGEKGYTNNWEVILNPATRQIAKKNEKTGAIIIRTYSPEKQCLNYRYLNKDKTQKSASRNKWDDHQRQTEYTKYDDKNHPIYTYWYKWTDNGFIDKERIKYHNEKKERFHDYEYFAVDEQGNWTQQLMIRSDITGREKVKIYEKTTVRTIEYYDDSTEEHNETL